jgi:phage terminase small subunit
VTDNPQNPEESIDSDDIKEIQQDEGLTPADRMDLIANAVAEDADEDAIEDEPGNS